MEQPSSRRIITSRPEYIEALRQAFAAVAAAGCRELWICDPDFTGWPLGERAVIDSLTRWAKAHRRLTMLAASFDEIPRRHARFVEWRHTWDHVVECRMPEDIQPNDMPSLLLAPDVVTLRLLDQAHFRGFESSENLDAIEARETVDAISQRSGGAFPATVLGL